VFQAACREARMDPFERRTRPLIAGFAAMAREHCPMSLAPWLAERLDSRGGADRCFLRLRHIYGVGPKIASFILSETAWVFGVEDRVPLGERFLLQPIDTWVRRTVVALWPDLSVPGAPDLLVAKRIAETCTRLGVSGVEFNHGAWYFGSREVRKGDMQAALSRLLEEE